MELQLHDDNKILDVDFGFWLLPHIRSRLISNISKYNLTNWNTYFNESDSLKRLYRKTYKASDIVLFAANNLTCKGVIGEVTISFNRNNFVSGFDRLKLSIALKLINYGNLDVKACPIFTDTLNYFADNIDDYIKLYYMI